MLRRRGTSLLELLIALTLAAILLGAATGSLLRQQRTATRLAADAQGDAQVRLATALLPAQLSLGVPSTDDLVPGSVKDTALQLRVAIASGISCDSARAPALVIGDTGLSADATASAPRVGDSLWRYQAGTGAWLGRAVTGVSADSMRCMAAAQDGGVVPMRAVLRVDTGDSIALPPFVPLRITRQERLVIYRGGDGSWQLGLREWSDVTQAMAAPQPVAGPFQLVAADGMRTGFRFFDAGGHLLSAVDSGRASLARVARIRLLAVGAPSRDSADVVVQPGGP